MSAKSFPHTIPLWARRVVGAFIPVMNPAPSAGEIIVANGVGGLADGGTTIAALQTATADALSPFVQAVHEAATRTLLAADAGDTIPLNGASNAIAITVPGTLFGTGGADRAFVCQHKVLSVAGGPLTFVGSAGIATIEYYGKNPGTTPYAAGDYLTVVVDSATTGYVFCASVIP